jgi:hypothetical protein
MAQALHRDAIDMIDVLPDLFILRGRFRSHAISQRPWRRRSPHRRALRRAYQLDLELTCPVPAQRATA